MLLFFVGIQLSGRPVRSLQTLRSLGSLGKLKNCTVSPFFEKKMLQVTTEQLRISVKRFVVLRAGTGTVYSTAHVAVASYLPASASRENICGTHTYFNDTFYTIKFIIQ